MPHLVEPVVAQGVRRDQAARLENVHAVENMASCRVADKAGFALEGTLRSAMLHADGWHDMHLHAAIADG